jgi:hypothetical protein
MLGNSSAIFNPVICNLLARINPESILELGCGEGKLGDLAKQSNLMPKLTAVQKLFSKSDLLHLNSKGYTNIIGSNILEYFKEGFDDVYDLIVAMDVIEHFLYSDAISIIDFALYKSKWLLLVWPSKPPQSGISNKFDRHRTSFELGTLTNLFDVAYYEQRGFAQVNYLHRYHLCVLLGHMNSANFS